MSKLLDGPVRTRAFWVFVIAELVAIAGTLKLAPDLVGQAESIAMHVINIVFFGSVMAGTAGTVPVTKLEQGPDGVYREKTYGAGEAGMATSELLLLVITICVVVGLVVGWGLAT